MRVSSGGLDAGLLNGLVMKTCGPKILASLFVGLVAFQAQAWNPFNINVNEDNSQFASNASGAIYVNSDNLSLRSAPFVDGSSTYSQQYRRNTKLNVIRHDGNWYFVSDGNGRQGWVNARQVSRQSPQSSGNRIARTTAPAAPASAPETSAPVPHRSKRAVDPEAAPVFSQEEVTAAPQAKKEAPKAPVAAPASAAPAAPAPSSPSARNPFPDVPGKETPGPSLAPAPSSKDEGFDRLKQAWDYSGKDGCISSFPGELKSDATKKEFTSHHSQRNVLINLEKAFGGQLEGSRFSLSKNSGLRQLGAKASFRFYKGKTGRVIIGVSVSHPSLGPQAKRATLVTQRLCVQDGHVTAELIGTGNDKGKAVALKIDSVQGGVQLTGNFGEFGVSDEPFARQ